jgi:pyruvate dehydrogenase E2 component (dihydrolipoamide acetyltransferase)
VATQVTLPRLGQGMETGTILRWLKSVGDRVEKGDVLYEVETEKATQEVEADESGVLLKLVAQEGDEIEVGKPIAVIGEEGEKVPDESPSPSDAPPAPATEAPAGDEPAPRADETAPCDTAGVEPTPAAAGTPPGEPSPEAREQAAQRSDGRVKASPLARRIAKERGIDLARLEGTGPEGRIVAEDVERAAAAPPGWAAPLAGPAEVEVVKLTGVRRTIARRLTEAWSAPAFQIAMSADMRAVLRLRELLVDRTAEGAVRPTVSDILVKASALALLRHRPVNAVFAGEEIHVYPTANIGLAVAIDAGLVVPVIPNCERRSVREIAEARADVVARARSGKLTSGDLEGGTFTISNLGMYGVERFTAVLNPPQAAILAVGAIEERPVAEDGAVAIRPRMDLNLTCDHRTIDGATASEFLRTLKDFLEEPALAL